MSVEALRAYVEELLALQGFPGLALAVTNRETLVASESFGLANLDAGTPVSRETHFEFGSIGKTFTAVLVLQLHEQGVVELDEPVTRYLPWFEVRSGHGPITIRHLLTHSSGLMIGADMSANSRFDVWALRETETGCPPGTRYLYSNIGYRVLGFVVEEVTGLPYGEALRTRILEPLGLEATDPEITSEGRLRLAVGYQRLYDDRPERRIDPWVPAAWLETGTGDGSLAGTMEDLAAFLRALLDRGRGLMTPESLELMTSTSVEAEEGWGYGFGLGLREHEGRREFRHGGSMPGFGATMLGDLDSGLGVAVAVNVSDELGVTDEVATAVLNLYRDESALPSVSDPFAVEDASKFEGLYVGDAGRLVLEAERDRLFLDGVALEPRGTDCFLADHPGFALFLLRFRREDGRIVEAVHGGDLYRREGAPATTPPATPPEWSAYPGHYRAYNPWYSNFRVVLREGELIVVFPWGLEWTLAQLPNGDFRLGSEEWWPERLRFDAIVAGTALRVDFSGEAYYRVP